MHILLTVLGFAFFIGLDYVLSRRRAARDQLAPAKAAAAAIAEAANPVSEPVWVAGYQLPESLHYHRGHTWARVLDEETVAVGLDDFSRRVVGDVDRVRLPAVGSYQRQGRRGFEVGRKGRLAGLLAPVEGEVIALNEEVTEDPATVAKDPYGRGWLYKVRVSNLAENLRNLLNGRLAQRWTEDERDQLELRLMVLQGSVLQDGGEPSPDFAEHLDTQDWRDLTEAFLLTPSDAD